MRDRPWFAHYDRGVPRSLAPYPSRTLLDYLADAARDHGEHPFLWFKGREVSFAEVERESDAFASALAGLGVEKGDRVALVLPNCPQFIIAEVGAWKAGAIVVPLNPTYTDDELLHPLQSTTPKVVVTLNPFYERVKKVQPQTTVRRVVTTNIKEYFPALLRLAFTLLLEKKGGHRATPRDGDLAWRDFLAPHTGRRPAAPRPAPKDVALILMSGGTTGRPKGVPGRHESLVMTALQFKAWLASAMRDGVDRIALPLPMFHSYGAVLAMPGALISRNLLALIPNPRDLDDVVKTIAKVQPVFFAGVPTLYNALLNHRDVKSGKVSFRSLKVCASGAAPLMAETKKQFESITGARITEAYALTESLIAGCGNPIVGASKTGSVGMPLPDVDVSIVDSDDPTRELAAGEVGEILLRGPQMMTGYWNDEAETAQMVVKHADGITWLHTADLGFLDPDGFLFIVDRKKDLMKPNGMQVWPREVEEVIAAHPAVAEVGVRGFPDAAHGEIAVAFVVLKPGAQATEKEIRDFCREHLAPYKVPSRVLFRAELPKTLVGKVLRRALTLDPPVPAA